MRRARSAFAMLQGQMADWLHSPRTIISGLVILALTYMNVRSFAFTLDSYTLYAHFGETVYHYLSTGFGNISLVSALFLIMIAEIPRQTMFQNAMLVRSSRTRWFLSQVTFCLVITLLMILSMLILSMVLTLPRLTPGSGWSDMERIAADPDAEWNPQLIPEYARNIMPWQGCFAAGIILFFFWFSMVLVILFCTLSNHPNAGLILYVSILVLHVTVLWESLPSWMRYMPASFATMSNIASAFQRNELSVIPKVIAVYFGIDLLFIGLMRNKVKHMDLFFAGKDGNE